MHIEISKEIEHLSSEEIEELYEMYISGTKNQELIELFDIDINPNKLIKIFPPIEHKDILCPYCQVSMFTKRKSKSSYDEADIVCLKCKHKKISQNYYGYINYCSCINCNEAAKKSKAEKKINDKRFILDRYGIDNIEPIAYSELDFLHKLYLVTLFKIQTDEKFDYIQPLDDCRKTQSLSPTESMDIEIIMYLYNANIIIVDPNSRIEYFDTEDENDKEYGAFNVKRVNYLPNITFNENKRASLSQSFNIIYHDFLTQIDSSWSKQVRSFMYNLALEEVMKNIQVRSNELDVMFIAEEKTRRIVLHLLKNFSVSEVYYFVRLSVENAHIFYSKGLSKGKKHAGNTIPGKLLSLGERAINENWDTYKYSRNSMYPRSAISIVFHDLLFQGNDDGFHKSPSLIWREELLPKYFPEDIENNEDDLIACESCGSINIKTIMNTNEISIQCDDCDETNTYSKKA